MVIIGISKIFVVGSNPTTPGFQNLNPDLAAGGGSPAPGFWVKGGGAPQKKERAHEYKNNKYLIVKRPKGIVL